MWLVDYNSNLEFLNANSQGHATWFTTLISVTNCRYELEYYIGQLLIYLGVQLPTSSLFDVIEYQTKSHKIEYQN